MVTALPYIIKAQICFAAFWIAYRLLFARDKAFARNRAYLLLAVAAAFVVPALSIPVWMPATVGSEQPVPYNVPDIIAIGIPGVLSPTQPDGLFEWSRLPYYIACAGSLAMLLALSVSGFQLWRITRRAALVQSGKIRIYRTGARGSAFSFFNRIYIDDQKTKQDIPQIVAHEMHHVKLRHSWDILLSSVLRILFWWNPFVWLWERSLREVHEFQADDAVLNNGFDSKQYITLILEGLTVIHPEFVSGFSYSLIKKRLIMISQNRQKRSAKFRILLALPLAGLLIVCFSFTERTIPENNYELFTAGMTDVSGTVKGERSRSLEKEIQETLKTKETPDAKMHKDPETTEKETSAKTPESVPAQGSLQQDTAFINGAPKIVYGTPSVETNRKEKPGKTPDVKNIPLIIIDGNEVDNVEDLNPANVGSVSVLKDAAATAVFGVKGENGVLVITTKTDAPAESSTVQNGKDLRDHPAPSQQASARGTDEKPIVATEKQCTDPQNGQASVNLANALAGRLAGLSLTRQDPLTTIITSRVNTPLIIIDGKEVDNVEDLNPANVASVSILKDAAATAVFGRKGEDGVIMITTKTNVPAESQTERIPDRKP